MSSPDRSTMLFPPESMLELIGWDEKSHASWHKFYAFERDDRSFGGGTVPTSSTAYYHLLTDFYGICTYDFKLSDDFLKIKHMPLLFDGMQNASKHGCQEEGSKTYSYGAFFGSSGICIGFQDEGGYFRRPEIKKIFEEKDMESLLRFQHANAGITRFFTETDGLFVDSEHQVLYCAQTFKDGDTVAIESQGPRKYVHTKNRLTT